MATRTTAVRISAQIQEYIDGMQKVAQTTREAGTAGEKLAQQKQAFQMLGTALTVVGGAMTAVTLAVAKTGIEYNSLQQSSRAALSTLLGGAEAANAQMDKLDTFARTSPFAKQTFITAQQQMLAFGIESQKVIPYLDAIQDAVAAAGGSSQQLSEVAFVMAQISAAGKITGQDLMQFGQRGINAAELIGLSMGKTGAQIKTEITAGTLGADEALDALAAGMKDKFDGAAANVKDTFAGAMDRVQAAWRDLSADLMKPLVDPNGGGALVDILNWAADLMRAVQQLPEPIKLVGGALFAVAGMVALAGGAFLLATPQIAHFKAAMETLGITGARVRGALSGIGSFLTGPWGVALMVATAGVVTFMQMQEQARQKARSYADALAQGADAARDLAASNLTAEQSFLWISRGSAADAAKTLGLDLGLVADAAEGNAEAFEKVNKVLDTAYAEAYHQSMKDVTDQQAAAGEASAVLREALNEEIAAYESGEKILKNRSELTGESAEASKSAAAAYLEEAGTVKDLNSEIMSLVDTINEANGVARDAVTTNANYQAALEGLNDLVEKNGLSLDQSTASGSANAAAMSDLADKADLAAQAQLEQDLATMSADDAALKYTGTLASQRQAFINAAVSAGYNKDEVNKLADAIYKTPSEKDIAIIVETAQAHQRIAALQTALAAVRSFNAIISAVPGKATGGPIHGPGTGTSDTAGLFALSNGEHVLTAAEVAAAGGHGAIEAWRRALISGDFPGMATGGPVRSVGAWQQVGQQFGFQQQAAAQGPVQVSLAGAQMTLMVDGSPIRAVVHEQLIAYDSASERVAKGRVR